jgi:hypothetical protein
VTTPYIPFKTMKHSWSKKQAALFIPNCRPFHPSEKPSCANSLLSPASHCSYLPLTKFYHRDTIPYPNSWSHMCFGIQNFSDFVRVILLIFPAVSGTAPDNQKHYSFCSIIHEYSN